MAYNIFVVLSEPFRFLSLAMLLRYRNWSELLFLYLLYLLLESYPFWIIQRKLDSGYKPIVYLLYPLFGLANAVLRLIALFVWFHKRFITGEMRRKTEKDRRWSIPPTR